MHHTYVCESDPQDVCIMHAYACACMMGITPTHPCAVPMGVPTHTHRYIHVCMSRYVHSVGYPPTTHVPTRTYHCVYTYVYMQVPVLPTHAMVLVCAWASTRGCLCGARCGGPRLLLRRVAPLPRLSPIQYCEGVCRRAALRASVSLRYHHIHVTLRTWILHQPLTSHPSSRPRP